MLAGNRGAVKRRRRLLRRPDPAGVFATGGAVIIGGAERSRARGRRTEFEDAARYAKIFRSVRRGGRTGGILVRRDPVENDKGGGGEATSERGWGMVGAGGCDMNGYRAGTGAESERRAYPCERLRTRDGSGAEIPSAGQELPVGRSSRSGVAASVRGLSAAAPARFPPLLVRGARSRASDCRPRKSTEEMGGLVALLGLPQGVPPLEGLQEETE